MRIGLVGADEVYRSGLEKFLCAQADVEQVICLGSHGLEVREDLLCKVDVTVIDLDHADKRPRDILIPLVSSVNCPIIALSKATDLEHVIDVLRLGIKGFILKGAEPQRIYAGIVAVLSGLSCLNQCLEEAILEKGVFIYCHKNRSQGDGEQLTVRELDILRLVAAGLSNAEVAGRLGIATRTVKRHLVDLFAKIHVRSRTQAINLGFQRGWLSR